MDISIPSTIACVFVLFIGLVMVAILSAIRIVPEYQRLVIFRLGRALGARGPGLVLVIPLVDTPITVDLRETKQEFARQSAFTQDGVNISADLTVAWRVVDPVKSVVCPHNLAEALSNAVVATWRSAILELPTGKLRVERAPINSELCARLDQVTCEWGVKVTSFEIREMVLPELAQSVVMPQMSLIGLRGKVSQSLMPTGKVQIELDAVADELLTTGDEVVITEIEDSRLRVARTTRP